MITTTITSSSFIWPAASINLVITATNPPEDPPAPMPALPKPSGPLPSLNAAA